MFHAVIAVEEGSRVSEGRRVGSQMALAEGLEENQIANVSLIATEAGTNLVKHGQAGELHLARLTPQGSCGLDILSIDHGPGIQDIDRCLRDGFSTSGTAGTGLGAIVRLSHRFDIFTAAGKGTVLFSRVCKEPAGSPPKWPSQMGAVQKPIRNEIVCGDAWYSKVTPHGILVLVADGLGHGLGAADASTEAVSAFRQSKETSPLRILEQIHVALRGTRGAAVAVAHLDYERQVTEFAGLGNICAALVTPAKSQSMISHNGTAGHEGRRLQMFSYPLPPDAVLVMHSDGMTANWDLAKYPGLITRHAAVIAGVLYRDATRNRDDVCVVVVKREP